MSSSVVRDRCFIDVTSVRGYPVYIVQVFVVMLDDVASRNAQQPPVLPRPNLASVLTDPLDSMPYMVITTR